MNAHTSGSSDSSTPSTRGFIGWWARNGVAANLLMVVSVAAGFMGFTQMDRLVFPSIGLNTVGVTVTWEGASPQEVEEQIVARIEEAVVDLEGIEEISSVSSEGGGEVTIEADRNIDMNEFVDEVKLRVDAINNLPSEARRPVVTRWRSSNWYMGLALHGDLEPLALKRLADDIRDDISTRIPGGSRATVSATLDEEVAVEVSEASLRRYNLNFDEVARAIANTSLNSSAGRVRTDVGSVSLNTRNLADNATDFEDIVIRQTADGAVVRVSDVARVIDGFEDASLATSFNGKPMALIGLITLEQNMDVVRTRQALSTYLEEKNAELPAGVELSLWWDESEAFSARVATISSSALIGLALVFVVLILFLRPTVALWVTAGIAVAFAGTFAILHPIGVSLNMLSLFAFLLVIGVVVDDAIIVGENIHNQVERGLKGVTAAVVGTQLVAKPVIFAVITTMMAFAPWMLLSGPEVQFTRQISLVVVAALTFSLIESLLILPNHLAHMKPQRTDGFLGPLVRTQRGIANGLVWVAQRLYRPLAEMAVRGRYATLTLFVGMFVMSVATLQLGYLRFSFMPEVESDYIQINLNMPDGTSFTRVQQVRRQLEDAKQRYSDRMNAEYEGLEVIRDLGLFAFDGGVEAYLNVAPPEDRPQTLTMRDITEGLRDELGPIPDAEEIRIDYTFNNNEGGISFALFSKDLDALVAASDDLEAKLSTYADVFDVRDSMQAAADEARITLLPNAETLGLTLGAVTRQLRQAFFGEEVQRLPRDGEDVPVRVRLTEEERRSLDTLRNVRIRMDDGREVPLGAVAKIDFATGVDNIQRRNRQRAIYVVADVRGDAASEIEADLNENFFPEFERRHPEVGRDLLGDREAQAQFMQEVTILLIIMLLAMYVLLAVAFGAIFQPLLVMTAIPFSLVGAVVGHLVMGIPLALFSFFGMGAAAGVVVNDNLVLIDYVNRLRKETGAGAFQALIEAGVARFRPILLTSVTTFLGILPMMAERSTQAQFLKPMVVALGFAVVFALFLTLFLVPALYAIGTDVSRYFKWAFLGRPRAFIGSTYDPHADYVGPMGVVARGDQSPDDVGGRPAPAE